MTVVERSVLIEHSAARMRALVEDIDSYPQFLPWCGAAEIVSRSPDTTVATLTIDFHGIRQQFTTENSKVDGEVLRIRLVSGPFRALDGEWRFQPLGEHSSKVTLRLAYDFSSRLLEGAIGPVFRQIASSLVDAFVKRADTVRTAHE
jgi:ribosome-associated toxin RatA of RatAB toxin-antitoxin module